MSEVTELAASEIDRGTGVSTGGAAEQIYREENSGQAAPAEMTAEQTKGIADLATMRARAADPSVDGEQRAAILKKMGDLAQYVLNGKARPEWYGEAKQNARETSTAEADPMAETFAHAGDAMTSADQAQLVQHAKVKGLDAAGAASAVEFCTKAGLDKITARVLTDRLAHHTGQGYGTGAELSKEMHADLFAEASRRFGGEERLQSENAMARAYVEHVRMADWVDKNAGSLAYDVQTISMLAYKARSLGLRAAK